MKTLILTAAISVIGTGSVLAADLSKAPAAIPSAYDWTGVYVGGHVGGGWENVRSNDDSYNVIGHFGGIGLPTGSAANMNSFDSSFLGGAQIGANYQIGRLVLGTELDWSWTGLHSKVTQPYPVFPAAAFTGTETFNVSTHWLGTATTRLGVARDNWLLYGTVGAAWADSTYTLTAAESAAAGTATLNGTFSHVRAGWTVGAGLEWGYTANWTVKLEYDYIDLGAATETIPVAGVTAGGVAFNGTVSANLSQSISEVKVGVNYKMSPGFLFW